MLMEEKTMKTEKIYDGKVVNLRVDTVELPDKKYSKREIVEHPGAVGIIAITDQEELIIVKQYRKPVEKFLLEIPAGKLELNEEPRETGIRELKEETGYEPGNLEYVFEFYPSPGITTEKIHLFIATDLRPGERQLDDGEFVEVEKIAIKELKRKLKRGEILDSKTVIAIYLAEEYLKEKGV